MVAPSRPFSQSELLKRLQNLRALEVAHFLVSFVFYAFVAGAVVQFALRLFIDRGTFAEAMLSGALYCIGMAAVCLVVMLILGLIGKTQTD